MENSKGFIQIIIILLALVLVAGGAYYFGTLKNSPSTTSVASIQPSPSPVDKFMSDPTANWKTYNFSNSVSFKIPAGVSDPKYVNAGHYAIETVLSGSTTLQVWGADGASPTAGKDDYNSITQNIKKVQGVIVEDTQINGLPALKFKINATNNDFIWGGDSGLIQDGVVIKMSDGRPLVVVHYQGQTLQKNGDFASDETIFNQILSTFKFTEETTQAPTPKPSSAKTLPYQIPTGWLTTQDSGSFFEIGYNPSEFKPISQTVDKAIMLGSIKYPQSIDISLQTYTGGSEHQFIYSQLGYTDSNVSQAKTLDYSEKEYLVNGKQCLIIYGLTFSASGATWGMCAMSPTQAIFFAGLPTQAENEQFIQTFRLLK